ncbi:HET-domain-containing protein [Phaeosphaeriaceae sp. SRC1lsM3a]|nr:HET-domain-containing protein [Stagonospora sp. SRC1lsM3a]
MHCPLQLRDQVLRPRSLELILQSDRIACRHSQKMSKIQFRNFRKAVPDSTTARYQYGPLPDNYIRLLKLLPCREKDSLTTIECELRSTRLDEARVFSALSYAWGNDRQKESLIVKSSSFLSGWSSSSISITPTLFAALKRLRHPTSVVWLWVDQVCINQRDAEERSTQVKMMRAIYEKAERTIVWLGYADADTEVLISIIDELKKNMPPPQSDQDVQQEPSHLRVRDRDLLRTILQGETGPTGITWTRREVLIRFLGRDWFRRAWVYQEAVVATKVEVVWGRLRVSLDLVAALVLSAYSFFKSEEGGKWYKQLKETKGFGPLRSIWFDRQEDRGALDFLGILWRARKYLLATDHRDMVYSFLGFHDFRPELQIRPDYTVSLADPKYACSVEDSFIILARSAIASSGTLRILTCIAPTRHSVYKLPSWVPNWAERRFTCGSPIVLPGMTNAFDASQGKQHDFVTSNPRHMIVKGHIIAHIRSLMEHKINNCYSHSRVSDAIGLNQLVSEVLYKSELLKTEMPSRSQPDILPYTDKTELGKILLRVILADGAFSAEQPIGASMLDELLRVYQHVSSLSEVKGVREHELYQYLRQNASVAHGKAVFLTDRMELGLGYANLRCGDIICLLHGSNTPCILRRSPKMTSGCYKFLGQCYLDGWMYGRNECQKEEVATAFTLV